MNVHVEHWWDDKTEENPGALRKFVLVLATWFAIYTSGLPWDAAWACVMTT
jgi:hypothetical protein